MAQVVNKIKQLFCKHKWVTISNFYGDMANYKSSKDKTIRSEQICALCYKHRLSPNIDNKCKIINYDIHYDKGIFKEVKNQWK